MAAALQVATAQGVEPIRSAKVRLRRFALGFATWSVGEGALRDGFFSVTASPDGAGKLLGGALVSGMVGVRDATARECFNHQPCAFAIDLANGKPIQAPSR